MHPERTKATILHMRPQSSVGAIAFLAAVFVVGYSATPLSSEPAEAMETTNPEPPTVAMQIDTDLYDEVNSQHPQQLDPSLMVAFHAQLGRDVLLQASSEAELMHFIRLKHGHFARGRPSFEAFSGTFTAPWAGVYSFTALVNFQSDSRSTLMINDTASVSVAICIESDCTNYVSLQSRATVAAVKFGTVVTGSLEIKKDDTVSVVIQNWCDRPITVDETTSFMGYFLEQ